LKSQTKTSPIPKNAIFLNNASLGGIPTQYIRGTWSGSTNATISFWFNLQSTGGYQSVFSAYQSTLYVGVNPSNVVYIDVPTGSTYAGIMGPTITNNTWYNIILIFQTNGLCSFYVNNQLFGTYTTTGIGSQATTAFSLGAYDNSVTNAFNGYIDDFKIYNTVIPFTNQFPSQQFTSIAVSNSSKNYSLFYYLAFFCLSTALPEFMLELEKCSFLYFQKPL
jgi:hypothetical protein